MELVQAEALAAPPPATPSFVGLQGYSDPPPAGIDADFASAYPGARGDRVNVVDIEYSWNRNHEDLTKSAGPGVLLANGTPRDPFNNPEHGTAVLGELIATDNSFGVTGLVPNAGIAVVNAENVERGYVLADSINRAMAAVSPGDVILIEQQAAGIGGAPAFVPSEWDAPVYDAVRTATAAGVIVVEAAGNGGQDLDSPGYGTPFPAGRPDSGAIIVGAGGCNSDRSRRGFSTYGSRVNLQGWGGCVATTGYGHLYQGGPDALYTNSFSGTSSASPIVASAAAAVSSAHETVTGTAPSPATVRNVLVATGTPQSDPAGGHIGPLPNLRAALASLLPPAVTAVSPTAGATGVPRDALVYPSFSEAMDKPATQAAFSLKRTSTGAAVSGSFSWFGNALVFRPSAPLAAGVQYTATVSTAARDLAGNALAAAKVWSFTTSSDATAPTVPAVSPTSGATAVPTDALVYPSFSEAMDKPTTQSAFSLKRTSTGTAVAGSFTWFGNALVFRPSSPLAAGTQYTATVSTAAKDLAGNHLAAARVWSFTTASPTGDLARGRPATASSVEPAHPEHQPGNAVDGNPATRWSSGFTDNEWWQVDLGSVRQIARVDINWESAYANAYKILTSTDGTNFSQAFITIIDSPGLKSHSFAARNARYVRIQGIDRATQYGISFWTVSVYAPGAAAKGSGVTDQTLRTRHSLRCLNVFCQ